MEEEREKRVTVKVGEQEHRQIRIKCAELGVTISDVMRDLLRLWLEGKVKLPQE